LITVDGKKMPWQEGMCVADLLEKIDAGHQYAVVKLNDRYVSKPHFAATRIPDQSEIYLIPMIAGG
jgi:thiamine biosynthesis protein ThiS